MLHPAQWRRLVAGAVLPAVAVEELVRWDAPLQLFDRWVLDDTHVAGRPVRRGERVALLFGAANRDPRRFPDPDRFDVGRGDSGHLGFGAGIHYCLGASLARCELEASLTELRNLAPALRLAAEPRYQPTFVLRGLTSLLVEH
jgi:cytochrome P450